MARGRRVRSGAWRARLQLRGGSASSGLPCRRNPSARPARKRLLAAALVTWTVAAAPPAEAIEITLSAGEFDVEEEIGDGPYEAGVAVRLDAIELLRWSRAVVVVPAFGVMANEDDAAYGWAGFAIRIPLGERWRLTPTLAAGAYQRGDGRRLGGVLEFRSSLEVAVRPNDRTAIGLEFYHLSNAGLHELNPGSNSLVLTVGFRP